jgi:hypothetical protein
MRFKTDEYANYNSAIPRFTWRMDEIENEKHSDSLF